MQRCSDKKPTPTYNPGMMALEGITKMLPPGAFVEHGTNNIVVRDEDGNLIILATPEHEVWQRANAAAHDAVRFAVAADLRRQVAIAAPAKPNPPAECKAEDPDAAPLSWEFDDDPPKGNPFDSSTPRWLADAIRRLHAEE